MPTNEQETKLKRYISNMPSLPTSVTKIMEICNNPTTSPADLNKVISLDPVLMGKVMKLINSAYYGLSNEITSLVRAIIMLGINTVKNLAVSTAVLGTLGKKSNFQALNMDGFWRHSLCVGVTSKMIAKKRGIDPKKLEEYFIGGLLHDVGKIPMNNILAEEYVTAISISDRNRIPLHKAEKEAMGYDHTEVGKRIAETWKLGREIRDSISFHHNPENYGGEQKDLLYTISFANYYANVNEMGFSGNRFPERVDSTVQDYLGIDLSYLEDIEDSINNAIEKARVFLKLA